MKRTLRNILLLLLFISLMGCSKIESKDEERYSSLEDYIKTVNATLIKEKELENSVVLITESESGSLQEHILTYNDSREHFTLAHSETIDLDQGAISIVESALQYSNDDHKNYITLVVNDQYLMEKGGAIYINLNNSDHLNTQTSIKIKPQIIEMDKSRVYIIENIYTVNISGLEDSSGKVIVENSSKIVTYKDAFESMDIKSINITDDGGGLLYHYLFDD
jgi:hypothetical protein